MHPFRPTAPAVGSLTPQEVQRYARQITLPEFGLEGQERLNRATVVLVGVGGLGSPAALYLAAAGVGRLVLADFDVVDSSNLQRQVLFSDADVGRPKLDAAAERLSRLNPHIDVQTTSAPFSSESGRRLVRGADVVIDGTDNFPTRYLVNDACVLERVPNVFGSIRGFEGQVSVFAVPGGPCYRCLHPEPPPDGAIPSCAEAGVLGVLPGVIGTIQAVEAIKMIVGIGTALVGRFLLYDALRLRFREIVLARDAECPACGDAPTITDLVRYDDPTCATRAREHVARPHFEVGADELDAWRRSGRLHQLVDVREPDEHALSSIDGAILIPLHELDRSLDRLARDRPVVVHCRSGFRSARAAERLRAAGIDARTLVGGLDAWSRL
jgi:sulfur-carrier protein adenylyltransferase/sulfurtransferase